MPSLKNLLVVIAGAASVVATTPLATNCGIFATGDAKNLFDLAYDSIYGENQAGSSQPGQPRTDTISIPGKTCKRLFCWNTSGIYICNQQETAWENVAYADVGNWALNLIKNCCPRSREMLDHYALSGLLTVIENRSISVGFANCVNGDDFPLAGYSGPGPNGWCV